MQILVELEFFIFKVRIIQYEKSHHRQLLMIDIFSPFTNTTLCIHIWFFKQGSKEVWFFWNWRSLIGLPIDVLRSFLQIEFKQVWVMLIISQVVEWRSEDHHLTLTLSFNQMFLCIGNSVNAETFLYFLLHHQEIFVLHTKWFIKFGYTVVLFEIFKFIKRLFQSCIFEYVLLWPFSVIIYLCQDCNHK